MDDWDAPTCTRCHGTSSVALAGRGGWVEVNCWTCHGTGNADAQPRPALEPDQAAADPVSQHPAVTESELCPGCLGSRLVLASTDGRLRQRPCPDCTPPGQP